MSDKALLITLLAMESGYDEGFLTAEEFEEIATMEEDEES